MMEVRDCDDARLLGYLPEYNHQGDEIALPLGLPFEIKNYPEHPMSLKFKIAMVRDPPLLDPRDPDSGPPPHWAYQSMGYPLEQLRRIPGWADAE